MKVQEDEVPCHNAALLACRLGRGADPWQPVVGDDEFPVGQYGPRRLWDEVEAAHGWWVARGKPSADRWRFTVSPEGQRIELVGTTHRA